MNRNNEYGESSNDNNYYDRNSIYEQSNTSMTIGIIAIVFTIIPLLKPVAIILGIIAIVKGYKYRSVKTPALVGWLLGILSILASIISFLLIYFGYSYCLTNVFNFSRMFWF